MSSPRRTRNTTIRFDEDVRLALDEYCQRSRRPLNSAVNYLITEALVAKGQWPPAQQVHVTNYTDEEES
jgi:hypothetical protein